MSRRIDYYDDPSAPEANSLVPSAGERAFQEGAGEVLSPGGERVHEIRARLPARDVHGRGLPSGDV